MPTIHLIASITGNRSLGRKGELLFKISDDLKRFKALTLGHPIIMGRKTYESIGRPLPDRLNIVITRNREFTAHGTTVVSSFDEALEIAGQKDKHVFIIGGSEIYKEALPHAHILHLTLIDSNALGDVFFPEYETLFTNETFREEREDPKTKLKYTWVDLEK